MTRRHFAIHGCAVLVIVTTIVTPVLTSSLCAQGKWWADESCKQILGLTAEQSQQLEKIFQATLPSLRAAKEELDRQEARFSELLKRSDTTESEVTAAIDRLAAARGGLGKVRDLQLYRMRRVLTPEQRAKLEADHQRNQRERPHVGPGGPPQFDRGRPGSR